MGLCTICSKCMSLIVRVQEGFSCISGSGCSGKYDPSSGDTECLLHPQDERKRIRNECNGDVMSKLLLVLLCWIKQQNECQ